jgi:hypothetical protein
LSGVVQPLPSLQVVPSVALSYWHVPLEDWHTPAFLHVAGAAHVTGVPPPHLPALHVVPVWHLSVLVHAAPCTGVLRQAPAPSQDPSSPQVTPDAVQALCATLPLTTFRHWPGAPLVNGEPEQALQPVHA